MTKKIKYKMPFFFAFKCGAVTQTATDTSWMKLTIVSRGNTFLLFSSLFSFNR